MTAKCRYINLQAQSLVSHAPSFYLLVSLLDIGHEFQFIFPEGHRPIRLVTSYGG